VPWPCSWLDYGRALAMHPTRFIVASLYSKIFFLNPANELPPSFVSGLCKRPEPLGGATFSRRLLGAPFSRKLQVCCQTPLAMSRFIGDHTPLHAAYARILADFHGLYAHPAWHPRRTSAYIPTRSFQRTLRRSSLRSFGGPCGISTRALRDTNTNTFVSAPVIFARPVFK